MPAVRCVFPAPATAESCAAACTAPTLPDPAAGAAPALVPGARARPAAASVHVGTGEELGEEAYRSPRTQRAAQERRLHMRAVWQLAGCGVAVAWLATDM